MVDCGAFLFRKAPRDRLSNDADLVSAFLLEADIPALTGSPQTKQATLKLLESYRAFLFERNGVTFPKALL